MNAIMQFRAPGGDTVDAAVLRAAVEACPSGLAVIEDGLVLYANRAFAELFGYFHSSAVQGQALSEFLPEPQFFARASGQGMELEPSAAFDATTPASSGVSRHANSRRIEAACSRLGVPKRNLFVVSARHAGELEPKTELSADSPNAESPNMEAMGRLVGGVAHDFNNLLTGILLYCDLLIAGLEADSPLQAYVEEIRRAGGHSAGLIQQLLAVARPQVEVAHALSWNEVVSGMRNLLTRLLGENIELVTELADDAEPVSMNPVQMRQIALNLLLNARDAMPEGGRITLATGAGNAPATDSHHQSAAVSVELIVTDTGCGMDADTRSRLFEPFFTTKQLGHGHGLGMAMVGRMVKEQGGTVEVESQVGKGTRVTVRLPRANQKPKSEL
jgi:signal transduction histidine kinase